MEISIYNYLALGLFLFTLGILGTILTKNVIKVLLSIEIMLAGVNINFLTFARFCDNINLDGFIIALFYVGLGAVEFAVALYLFYIMYQKKKNENIESYSDL